MSDKRLANCLPTVDFPEPGKPTQAIFRDVSFTGIAGAAREATEMVGQPGPLAAQLANQDTS